MPLLALKALFAVALLSAAALSVGSWIALRLPASFQQWERIAFALLSGFGLLSLGLFLVGQFSFTVSTIFLVIVVCALAGARAFLRLLRAGGNLSAALRNVPKFPSILIAVILVTTAVAGLAEVTGDWNSDAVSYHLLGPRVWLRDGVIRPVPDNCHTAFPPTAETMYAALWAIGGPRAPAFSGFLLLGILLLAAASLGTRCGLTANEAWWLAAVVATMPAVYTGSVGCFVDGLYAAFVLAAVRVGVDADELKGWAIFGLLCGLAMGTKYTGLLVLPAAVVCIVWLRIRDPRSNLSSALLERNWRSAVWGATLAIASACLVASPYYLRNWILLGCPIYPPPPGFLHVCTPKYLSAEVLSEFYAYIHLRGAGLGQGIGSFLLLPFNLTYHTSNFHGAGGIGLAPLALGPIGLLAFRKNAVVRMLGIFALLLVIMWFVTQQESRFLIHGYVIGAIFAVLGWRQVSTSRNAALRILAAAVIAVSFGYGLLMIARDCSPLVHAVFSPAFAQARRASEIPYLESFQYLNHTSEVRKILILDRSVPSFYCEKDYLKPVGQWGERTLPGAPGPLEVLRQARSLGVSHILDVNSSVTPFQVAEAQPGLTLVLSSVDQRVYRVD